MKKLRRILLIVLTISMVFNCFGCGKNSTEETSAIPVVKGKYLVEDGASGYKIVIPQEAEGLIGIAAQEFNKFFKESTSVELPVITDDQAESDGKYISIGETTLLKSTSITYEYSELGNDGYKIVTQDENIYLIGGADYGSLYAVYELLSYLIEYDFFYQDCYTIAEGVSQIPLYDFDITDIPDIASRTASDGVVTSDNYTMYRMRVRHYEVDYIPIGNRWAHNSIYYVMDHENANDKWFDDSGKQVCYTAHGDEEEYQKLMDASFETMKAALIKYPEKTKISYSCSDDYESCTCEACTELTNKYGTITATSILFLNDLCERVDQWFESEEGKPYARDLKIDFWAYHNYEKAPVVYNEETGEYKPYDELKFHEDLYVFVAPIKMDFYASVYDTKVNKPYRENVEAWSSVSGGQMYIWFYSTNFNYYLVPYESFNHMQEYYQFAKEMGAKHFFDQRIYDESGFVTGWSNLKSYLGSKLSWDVDADVEALTDKFFAAYFGPAEDEMREYFEEVRMLTEYNREYNELGGLSSIWLEMTDEKYWPKDVLLKWIDYCNKAEEKIAVLKESNPELYDSYHEHIIGEKVSALYLYIEIYSYNTNPSVIDAYKAEAVEIFERLNMGEAGEIKTISEDVLGKWGIE